MQTFAATFASGPSGLDYMVAYPVLDLGTEGRITIIRRRWTRPRQMTRVPKLTGPLAGAHYDMIASRDRRPDQAAAGDAHLAAQRQPVGDRRGVELAVAAERRSR